MEFLYVLKIARLDLLRSGPTEEEATVLSQHAAYVDRLAREGVVELAGRTQNADESTFGLVIFRAESEDAAGAIMDQDPAVAHGVMNGTLYPYKISFRGVAPGGNVG